MTQKTLKDLSVSLTDAEIIALEDAIKVYKNFIKEKIGDKIEAPHWARLQAIKRLENKLAQLK
jgi:hypothetical protein